MQCKEEHWRKVIRSDEARQSGFGPYDNIKIRKTILAQERIQKQRQLNKPS